MYLQVVAKEKGCLASRRILRKPLQRELVNRLHPLENGKDPGQEKRKCSLLVLLLSKRLGSRDSSVRARGMFHAPGGFGQ